MSLAIVTNTREVIVEVLKYPLKAIAVVLVGLGIILPVMLGVLVPYGIVLNLLD